MPYTGEGSNPFGIRGFLEKLDGEVLEHLHHLTKRLEELTGSLEEKDLISLSGEDVPLVPVALTVDGGEGLAFEDLPLFAIGLVRVAAVSAGGQIRFPTIEHVLSVPELLTPSSAGEGIGEGDFKEAACGAMEDLFKSPPKTPASEAIQTLAEATGIHLDDLGTYYTKDTRAFTEVLRSVLEWAYLVWSVEKVAKSPEFQNLHNLSSLQEVLFVRDGRLAQTGVEKGFREKLNEYFERNRLLLVGISKRSRLVAEGLTARVIARWLEDGKARVGERFVLRVPDKLLEAAYHYERQWNADLEGSFVMGQRYVTKLLSETFRPSESVVVFDLPAYLGDAEVRRVGSTLHRYRSALFSGSVGLLLDAHARSSVRNSLAESLEKEILDRYREKLGEEAWKQLRAWLWL
jgi:hypothetical protein